MARESFFMGGMTITLEDAIRYINTFDEFEKKYSDKMLDDDRQLSFYLSELSLKYPKDYTEVSDNAGCATAYFGNLINGHKKNPSRDVLISICLSLGTTIDEVQQLLKYAGHAPLYVRRKRDVILWFAFMKGLTPYEADVLLKKRGYEPLTNEGKKEVRKAKKLKL